MNRDPVDELGHVELKIASEDWSYHYSLFAHDGEFDELNEYGFVLNDPVALVDARGEAIWVPVLIWGCRIAVKSYKVYRSITKARKALAKTCSALWAAYKVACNVGCNGSSCQTATKGYKAAQACVNGRSLYITLGCDKVGRGYGKRGKTNPRWRADKKTHEDELDRAKQALNSCRAKKKAACAGKKAQGCPQKNCQPWAPQL